MIAPIGRIAKGIAWFQRSSVVAGTLAQPLCEDPLQVAARLRIGHQPPDGRGPLQGSCSTVIIAPGQSAYRERCLTLRWSGLYSLHVYRSSLLYLASLEFFMGMPLAKS